MVVRVAVTMTVSMTLVMSVAGFTVFDRAIFVWFYLFVLFLLELFLLEVFYESFFYSGYASPQHSKGPQGT